MPVKHSKSWEHFIAPTIALMPPSKSLTISSALNSSLTTYYGMMNAYDQIGQIQLDRKQNQQALVAFKQGLGLAKQLKYRQDYFTAQIQKIGKE